MLLGLFEVERPMTYTAAKLAMERRERGLKLNLPEATAVITSYLLEGARNGGTVADLMESGRDMLSRNDVMDGVPEMLGQVQVEATFPDTAVMAVREHCLAVSSLAADAVRLRGQLEAAVATAFDDALVDAREVGVDAVPDAPDRALSPPRQVSV